MDEDTSAPVYPIPDPALGYPTPVPGRMLWRGGGILLVIGGLLSAIGAPVFSVGVQAESGLEDVGSWMTIFGLLITGAGYIVIALAARAVVVAKWPTIVLIIAGAIFVIAVLATIVVPTFSGDLVNTLSPAGSVLAVIAAIAIVATSQLRPAARVAFLLPTIWGALIVLLILARAAGAWSLTIQGLLYAVAGVLFLVSPITAERSTEPETIPAAPAGGPEL